jgi:hypothetical protein
LAQANLSDTFHDRQGRGRCRSRPSPSAAIRGEEGVLIGASALVEHSIPGARIEAKPPEGLLKLGDIAA